MCVFAPAVCGLSLLRPRGAHPKRTAIFLNIPDLTRIRWGDCAHRICTQNGIFVYYT